MSKLVKSEVILITPYVVWWFILYFGAPGAQLVERTEAPPLAAAALGSSLLMSSLKLSIYPWKCPQNTLANI